MEASKRIIINTIAQYGKSVINICLSLYSTRLVLDALSISDYGIYSLVGGVVGILGYLTNSLVVTTQRYLSYYQGEASKQQIRKVFDNSLLIHLVFGLAICLILLPLEDVIINHFLNIAPERLHAASAVYTTMVFMLFSTVMTSPFKALLIAHENIVYISVVEVADGILKLLLALSLTIIGFDKLIFYTIGMTCVITINLLAYIAYDLIKYEESRYRLGKKNFDKETIKQLLGFAGWTTYGMIAGICQSQGLTVVFNKFFSTTINAAFGIGTQVNGAVRFVSTSILNAMNPQIMKAEGSHDRQKMLRLAGKESKFSASLMMIISIPVMIELPSILAFWLKEVPPYTTTFCRALMLAFIVDQLTLGLHAANQATGKLRYYSLLTYTPKMMLVPIAWIAFKGGGGLQLMMTIYVCMELAVSLSRLPFMKYSAGLNVTDYLKTSFIPLIPLAATVTFASVVCAKCFTFHYHFVLTAAIAVTIGVISLFTFTLSKEERTHVLKMLKIKR